MKLPFTYYVRFTYKHKEYSHQFNTERPLTQEMIEHVIEGHVLSQFGRDYDPSEIHVHDYNYEEGE
jgi:hypothetical protein